jgi:hypothetical protein
MDRYHCDVLVWRLRISSLYCSAVYACTNPTHNLLRTGASTVACSLPWLHRDAERLGT